MAIGVVIVEDHPITAAALAGIVGALPDLEVFGTASTPAEAIALVIATRPDVVVLDHSLSGGTGIEAIRGIRDARPATAIVYLTGSVDEDQLAAAYEAGIQAYVPKTATPEDVIEAIRRAARGEEHASVELLLGLLRSARSRRAIAAAQDRALAMQRAAITDVRRGFRDGEFFLRYQPIVRLSDGATSSAEALIRWGHPERGEVGPADFLTSLAEAGLMKDLTEMVVRSAVGRAAEWASRGSIPSVGINVTASDVTDRHLLDLIASLCGGRSLQFLTLELTETDAITDTESVEAVLHEFRERGAGLAIDDFGTGYSALSYLQRLPVTALKIDRSFVAMSGDPVSQTIVKASIDLAHGLGLSVTAEGIEDKGTADRLRQMNCDLGQGFHFAPPLTVGEFADHVEMAGRSARA